MGKNQLIHGNEFHLLNQAEIHKATGKLVEALNFFQKIPFVQCGNTPSWKDFVYRRRGRKSIFTIEIVVFW